VLTSGRVQYSSSASHGSNFFVGVNLLPRHRHFNEAEYAVLINVLKESRQRPGFLLCGYVLMPDHWHALIWPQYPLLLWQVLHDVKEVMTLRMHARRGTRGPFANTSFGTVLWATKRNSITAWGTCT